jgi:RNA polymerase sigma-70 factor (ECF subfamily)
VRSDREQRFEELAYVSMPVVAAYLRRRIYPLNEDDLDDMLAEILVIVWNRFDDVPNDNEVPWIIGVAKNVLNNSRRKRSRRQSMQSRILPPRYESSTEEKVIAIEDLRSAMEKMRKSDREVLLLHHWDGFDVTQIAIVYGISHGAAAMRLSRAERRLREAYASGANPPVTDASDATSSG